MPSDRYDPSLPHEPSIDDSGYNTGEHPWALDGDGYPSTRPPGYDVLPPFGSVHPEPISVQPGANPDNDGNPFPDAPKVGQMWFFNGQKWYWSGVEWILVPAEGGGGDDTDDWIPPYVMVQNTEETMSDGVTHLVDLIPGSYLSPDTKGYPNPDFPIDTPWGKEDIVFHFHVLITTESGTPTSYTAHVYTDDSDEPNNYNEIPFSTHGPINFSFLIRHRNNRTFHVDITPYGDDAVAIVTLSAAFAGPWYGSED